MSIWLVVFLTLSTGHEELFGAGKATLMFPTKTECQETIKHVPPIQDVELQCVEFRRVD
jgi:hypothetical protein